MRRSAVSSISFLGLGLLASSVLSGGCGGTGAKDALQLPDCRSDQYTVKDGQGVYVCQDIPPPGPMMVRFCMDNDSFKDPESSASTGVPGVVSASLDLVKSPGGSVVQMPGQQVLVANFTAEATDVWVHPYSHLYTSATRLMANADLYVGGVDDAHRVMNWSPAPLHATNSTQCHDMFYVLYPSDAQPKNLAFKVPANTSVQMTQTVDTGAFVSGQEFQQVLFFQYSFDGVNTKECGDSTTCLLKGRVLKIN